MGLDTQVDALAPLLGNEVALVLAALLATLAGLGYRRYKGEKVTFGDLPFRLKIRLIYAIRAEYFNAGVAPETTTLDASIDEATALLGEHGYMPKWPLSYHYRDEDENMIRYYYDNKRDLPHRQVHVRLFADDEGRAKVYAHEEPSGLHHPREHLASENLENVTEWVVRQYRTARDDDDGGALDPRLWAADRS